MHRFFSLLMICVALLAMLSPSFATGVCVANGKLPAVSMNHDGPVQLPSPCDMQGGKRVMPAQPDFARASRVEVPRATMAQWALGLADEPMRQGRAPAAELPPPR